MGSAQSSLELHRDTGTVIRLLVIFETLSQKARLACELRLQSGNANDPDMAHWLGQVVNALVKGIPIPPIVVGETEGLRNAVVNFLFRARAKEVNFNCA
jgi:hypothetical protein